LSSPLYLVTGGAGFVGSHLVEELLRRGKRVRVVDDFSTGKRENLEGVCAGLGLERVGRSWWRRGDGVGGELELMEGDVSDPEGARRAVEGVTYVLHQAAIPSVARSVEDPVRTDRVNVGGTLQLLRASVAAGVRRFVYASSSSVYGDTPSLPKREDMAPDPLSPYAVSKLAGEHYCRVFHRVYGLETVSLRYFNVFGPRQDPSSEYAAVIPKFLSAVLRGEPPTVFGDGEQTRDFTYVANVVEANLLALESPEAPGKVLNVGSGERVSLNRLLELIYEACGEGSPSSPLLPVSASFPSPLSPPRRQPAPAAMPQPAPSPSSFPSPRYLPPRPGDVRHSQADIALARKVLGYEPRVSLREGLRLTVEWLVRKPASP